MAEVPQESLLSLRLSRLLGGMLPSRMLNFFMVFYSMPVVLSSERPLWVSRGGTLKMNLLALSLELLRVIITSPLGI